VRQRQCCTQGDALIPTLTACARQCLYLLSTFCSQENLCRDHTEQLWTLNPHHFRRQKCFMWPLHPTAIKHFGVVFFFLFQNSSALNQITKLSNMCSEWITLKKPHHLLTNMRSRDCVLSHTSCVISFCKKQCVDAWRYLCSRLRCGTLILRWRGSFVSWDKLTVSGGRLKKIPPGLFQNVTHPE